MKPALSGCRGPGGSQESASRLQACASPGENIAFLSVMLTLPASSGGEMGQCWGASSRGHITPAHCSPEYVRATALLLAAPLLYPLKALNLSSMATFRVGVEGH